MLTGERLELLLPPGIDASELIRCSDRLAVALQAGRVTVAANPHNAARVQVQVMRRDPLAGPSGIAWPHANRERLSLWEPIPVGLDEKGAVVRISLAERNVLIGGEPGAGKSSALSMLVATAALDPGARLWLLDGKLVELAPWSGCADGSAGVRVDDAVRLLRVVRDEMEARYLDLLKRKRRKVSPEDGLPFHVVVCDELAHYLNSGEKRDRAEFAELLRDLVSRGRAAGVIVLAATQKPASDVVPTSLRDLFGFRWALRCSTPQASDTILGSGWASAGYSATTIDSASRGLGYLLHEGGEPNRMRAFYLNDQQVEALAERAEALRQVTR
ncbi:MAG TPA: FtsK/SpoIIIE domain-containing protein [Acidimicrobiales bacterium]|nr:FtsK/SpoIIIE domain-containing protein [Acidimicrobiales bacterium]